MISRITWWKFKKGYLFFSYCPLQIQALKTCYQYISKIIIASSFKHGHLFVFVALRPKSTAMVIAGRSIHLTTLYPGQA